MFLRPHSIGFSIVFVALSVFSSISNAQISPFDAERLGLEIKWHGQLEQLVRDNRVAAMVLWPHSTAKTEYVEVRIGQHVVRRILADTIDDEAMKLAYEQLTAKRGSAEYETSVQSITDNPPRIGLAGAKQRAEKVVRSLTLLGKAAEIGDVVSQPVTYLVSTTATGAVQVFNAETGQNLWTNYIGTQGKITYAPGVNDKYVAAINGVQLYVFELTTGKLVNSRKLLSSPGAGPLPSKDRIYVPGITGGLIGYFSTDLLVRPWMHNSVGSCNNPPVFSADRRFFAWTTEPHYVFVATAGDKADLWNRLEVDGKIAHQITPVTGGFIASTVDGIVFHISNDRDQGFRWKFSTGYSVATPPSAGSGIVFSVSTTGAVTAIEDATGDLKWMDGRLNVEQILSISKDKVYARTQAGSLLVLELESGKILNQWTGPVSKSFTNAFNDRIYLLDTNGRVICLRDSSPEYATPKMHFSIEPDPASNLQQSIPESPSSNSKPSSPVVESPFGNANPFGNSGAPATKDGFEIDPFGGTPKKQGTKTDLNADPFR